MHEEAELRVPQFQVTRSADQQQRYNSGATPTRTARFMGFLALELQHGAEQGGKLRM